jgi:hypothetical protein
MKLTHRSQRRPPRKRMTRRKRYHQNTSHRTQNTSKTHLLFPSPLIGSYCSHTYPVRSYSCTPHTISTTLNTLQTAWARTLTTLSTTFFLSSLYISLARSWCGPGWAAYVYRPSTISTAWNWKQQNAPYAARRAQDNSSAPKLGPSSSSRPGRTRGVLLRGCAGHTATTGAWGHAGGRGCPRAAGLRAGAAQAGRGTARGTLCGRRGMIHLHKTGFRTRGV